jgi:hypothetical protein
MFNFFVSPASLRRLLKLLFFSVLDCLRSFYLLFTILDHCLLAELQLVCRATESKVFSNLVKIWRHKSIFERLLGPFNSSVQNLGVTEVPDRIERLNRPDEDWKSCPVETRSLKGKTVLTRAPRIWL